MSASRSGGRASNLTKDKNEYEDAGCSDHDEAVTNAEHTEANLLPCNAAARLQARAESGLAMSPLAEFDQRLEQIIREFALRIAVPRMTEFEALWEAAIRVCDRYELGKSSRATSDADQSKPLQPEAVTSSLQLSGADAPAQTPPPIAA